MLICLFGGWAEQVLTVSVGSLPVPASECAGKRALLGIPQQLGDFSQLQACVGQIKLGLVLADTLAQPSEVDTAGSQPAV